MGQLEGTTDASKMSPSGEPLAKCVPSNAQTLPVLASGMVRFAIRTDAVTLAAEVAEIFANAKYFP